MTETQANPFAAVRSELNTLFHERAAEVDSLLAAIIAGEHVLLVGDPGTAKSDLVRALTARIGGAFFDTLCHRFQTPDEIFGPFSLQALKEDRMVRITKNRIAVADVAFLDEVFKGNPALLNTLLTLMNERAMEIDGAMVRVPLRMLVGASNELPDEGDELGAFFDRFLLRHEVKRLAGKPSIESVLFESRTAPLTRLTKEDLFDATCSLDAVVVPGGIRDSILKVREALHEAGIKVSDRRWKKTVKVLKARAVLDGSDTVRVNVLQQMRWSLWSKTSDLAAIDKAIAAHMPTWVKDIDNAAAVVANVLNELRAPKPIPMNRIVEHLRRMTTDVVQTLAKARGMDPAAETNARAIEADLTEAKNLIARRMADAGVSLPALPAAGGAS